MFQFLYSPLKTEGAPRRPWVQKNGSGNTGGATAAMSKSACGAANFPLILNREQPYRRRGRLSRTARPRQLGWEPSGEEHN